MRSHGLLFGSDPKAARAKSFRDTYTLYPNEANAHWIEHLIARLSMEARRDMDIPRMFPLVRPVALKHRSRAAVPFRLRTPFRRSTLHP